MKTTIKAVWIVIMIGLVQGGFSIPARGAVLYMDIPVGSPGSTVAGDLGFSDASGVTAFELRLTYSSTGILTTDPAQFVRNITAFPDNNIGLEKTNFLLETSPGIIYIVGLTPSLITNPVTIGSFTYNIDENAAEDDEQTITLSGKIYTAQGTIQDLSPTSVTFKIGSGANGSLRVTILPASAVDHGAQWAVDSNGWINSGSVYSGLTQGSHTVIFKHISYFDPPADQAVDISEDQTAAITGIYTPLDSDEDGIPDYWEADNGLNPYDNSDADEDWDGDGYTNKQEFEAGTDPNNPASRPGKGSPPTVMPGVILLLN